MITLRSSCGQLVQFVVLYCFDVPEVKYMSGAAHGTTVSRPFIRFLVIHDGFCRMDCAVNHNLSGTLSAREEYEMIMDRGI